MAMPETVELQIHDCGTMEQCISWAKQCLAICQPTSLIGKVSSLTIAQSSPPLTPSRSPSPQPKQCPSNPNNRRGQPVQCQSLRQITFKVINSILVSHVTMATLDQSYKIGLYQINEMVDKSLSQIKISFLLSKGQTPIHCYNCNRVGHMAVNCYQRPNINRF